MLLLWKSLIFIILLCKLIWLNLFHFIYYDVFVFVYPWCCRYFILGSTALTSNAVSSPITSPATAVTTVITTTTTTTTMVQSNKWVKNLSETPLTEAQVSLLAHRPSFAIMPLSLPYGKYITAVEQACLNLEPHNTEVLRAEIRVALRHAHNLRRNITREDAQALVELRKDHSRVILTADKGVALVVKDRADYNNKAQKLLEEKGTYKEIKKDPTNKLKNKLLNLLKETKAEGGIKDQLYKKMYPTGAVAPNLYGLPKIHRRGIPLRPIVSSRGSISYEVAKELSWILRPLVGSSPSTLRTLDHSKSQWKYSIIWCLCTFYIDPAFNIIRRKLELDQELHLRTSMSVVQIISLLEFCLKTTYFQFQDRFVEQLHRAAMWSPISPIVANLYMEDFENQDINRAECHPRVWKRFGGQTLLWS